MAVYGRFRERWNPTKVKSKVSKNNTFELGWKATQADPNDLSTGKLLLWINVDSEDDTNVYGAQGMVTAEQPIESVAIDIYSQHPTVALETIPVESAHFQPKALQFQKNASDDKVFIQTGPGGLDISMSQLAGPDRNCDTFISFWVRIEEQDFDSSKGHHLGGFYRNLVYNA